MSRTWGASLFRNAVIGVTGLLVAGVQPISLPKAYAATPWEIGIFEPSSAWNTNLIKNIESTVGVTFKTAKWYQDWNESLDTSIPPRLRNAGYLPELTWQPMVSGVGVSYPSIANGSYDTYLTTMANAVKNSGGTMRISFAAEMNGDWSPYYIGQSSPQDFVNAWRHIVDVFRAEGATNVEWVWAPNIHYYGEQYSYASFYPGDGYVTYVGLDGYNWGASMPWSAWQSFTQVFESSYQSMVALTGKQILIMETASAELGGSKAAWIADMFATGPTKFPRIKGITWFNQNKETDWRIQSSAASIEAFKNGVNGVAVTAQATPGTVTGPVATPKPKVTKSPKTTAAPAPTVAPAPVLVATPTPTTPLFGATATVPKTVISAAGARTAANALSAIENRTTEKDRLALLILFETLLVIAFVATTRRGRTAEGTKGVGLPEYTAA